MSRTKSRSRSSGGSQGRLVEITPELKMQPEKEGSTQWLQEGKPFQAKEQQSKGPEVGRVWLVEERKQELGGSRVCTGPGGQQSLARQHVVSL